MPRTIAVIDGNSLMHRAYHAVPPTMNAPDGTPTNAVFGFLSMLIKFAEVAEHIHGAQTIERRHDVHAFEKFLRHVVGKLYRVYLVLIDDDVFFKVVVLDKIVDAVRYNGKVVEPEGSDICHHRYGGAK